jgi:hypothetical protein
MIGATAVEDKRAIDDGIAIAQSLLDTPLESRAAAVLQKLVERFPREARLHLAQADLLRRAGQLSQAMQAVERALSCDAQDVAAQRLAAALHGHALPTHGLVGVPAPIRLLHNFFDTATHRQLLELALSFEQKLTPSWVSGINPLPDWRRSKVDIRPAPFRALSVDAIVSAAHDAVAAFAMPEFPFETVEMQFTAHNDGDFYKAHRDQGPGGHEHRRLSFVYYFYREPRAFSGGALALYDSLSDGSQFAKQSYSLVEPANNSLIVFPAGFWHEVQKVSCPSRSYGASRFTLNGWIGVKSDKELPSAS